MKGTTAGRIIGGQRSGTTRRQQAERAALVVWLPPLRAASSDHDRALVLARAVRTGIRLGYERAYNRFVRGIR